jgi:phytoene dehydrogenase-like protein
MDETYDVAVLGGGLSGLYAARTLLTHGATVCVLEARAAVGGRTRSIPFPPADTAGLAVAGDAYDVGGQWVGPTQALTLALIREFGLVTKQQPWFAVPPAAAAAATTTPPLPSSPRRGGAATAGTATGAGAGAGAGAGGSFSSGCAVPLGPEDAAEVAELTAELDALAASPDAAGPPWSAAARAWDALDCAARLRSACRGAGALRELLLYVQTVLAADPASVSFLYFLR